MIFFFGPFLLAPKCLYRFVICEITVCTLIISHISHIPGNLGEEILAFSLENTVLKTNQWELALIHLFLVHLTGFWNTDPCALSREGHSQQRCYEEYQLLLVPITTVTGPERSTVIVSVHARISLGCYCLWSGLDFIPSHVCGLFPHPWWWTGWCL